MFPTWTADLRLQQVMITKAKSYSKASQIMQIERTEEKDDDEAPDGPIVDHPEFVE